MSTDIITDTDAPLANAVEANAVKLVRDAFAGLQLEAMKIANTHTLDEDDRARLLTEASALLKGTRHGFVPGATPALALGAVIPVPAGTPTRTPEQEALLDMTIMYANTLTGGDIVQLGTILRAILDGIVSAPDDVMRNARIIGIQNAGDGSFPLLSTGQLDVSRIASHIQAELDSERSLTNDLQSDLTDARNERDAAVTQRDVANTYITRVQPVVDDAVQDLADLQSAVNADRVLKNRLKRFGGFRSAFRTALGL